MGIVKSFSSNEAPPGSFSLPITLQAGQEIFLTSIVLSGIQPNDRLKFSGTIGWSVNTVAPGLSELIVRIRRGSSTGPVVFETRDSIFLSVNTGTIIGDRTTSLDHAEIAPTTASPTETYFLTVRFESLLGLTTTRIEGPVHLSGAVIGY
jgi:hypothetical protein